MTTMQYAANTTAGSTSVASSILNPKHPYAVTASQPEICLTIQAHALLVVSSSSADTRSGTSASVIPSRMIRKCCCIRDQIRFFLDTKIV